MGHSPEWTKIGEEQILQAPHTGCRRRSMQHKLNALRPSASFFKNLATCIGFSATTSKFYLSEFLVLELV
jgi:hypothetical protein